MGQLEGLLVGNVEGSLVGFDVGGRVEASDGDKLGGGTQKPIDGNEFVLHDFLKKYHAVFEITSNVGLVPASGFQCFEQIKNRTIKIHL